MSIEITASALSLGDLERETLEYTCTWKISVSLNLDFPVITDINSTTEIYVLWDCNILE